MPYYLGEGDPEWEAYMERLETEQLRHGPIEHFAFVVPWQARTTVLRFPRTPQPLRSKSQTASDAAPAKAEQPAKPGFLARIFGVKPPPRSNEATAAARPAAEPGSDAWMNDFRAKQGREAEAALHRIAVAAAALRDQGVARLRIRYDGGNDEGFAHFKAVEMADGRRLSDLQEARDIMRGALVAVYGEDTGTPYGIKERMAEFERWGDLDLIQDAVVAFLGPGFGTGPYEMFGAVTVDCEACTITDEKDRDAVFGKQEGNA